jgi:hypothetical protein
MRTVPSTPVACSVCGRVLAAQPTLAGSGYNVRRHRSAPGWPWCFGSHLTDHEPVRSKP